MGEELAVARGRVVKLDDIDPDCRSQTRLAARTLNPRHELVDVHALCCGDLLQRIPHHGLQSDAGTVAPYNHVPDAKGRFVARALPGMRHGDILEQTKRPSVVYRASSAAGHFRALSDLAI